MEIDRSDLSARYVKAKRALFDKAYNFLNDRQREAMFTTEGPLLILAGAGSGKTTVLVNRIAYIIRYGNAYMSERIPPHLTEEAVSRLEQAQTLSVPEIEAILPEFQEDPCPPYRMMAITFTNKAAREIKDRLLSQFGDENTVRDIWSGTFHAICMRILHRFGDRIGYGSNFTIYDTDDGKRAVKAAMKRLDIDEKQFPVKDIMNAISHAKDRLISVDEYEMETAGDFRLSRTARVYREYQEQLKLSNAMDFDDIIMQTVRLLRECPDVREFYRKKFRYVCIDEYQDTNIAQFELAALLTGTDGNLMVVGDDDQSIYKFRGAVIENILNFDDVFPKARVIKLEQNYRSTVSILNAANEVISHNEGRKGKKLWTAGENGEKITLFKCEDQRSESRVVVDTILRLTDEKAGHRYHFRDCAVLYRTNAQSNSLENALAKTTIPYRILCGTRFSDRKEIRDAVAYLQLIVNHDDRERLLRIINEPHRKIGKTTLNAVTTIAAEQNCSLFEIMDTADRYPALGRSATVLKDFTLMIHRLTELSTTLSLTDLFDDMLTETGYRQMLEDGGETERDRLDNLEEFKSNLLEYTKQAEDNGEEVSLNGFLEEYALVADVDKYDETADAVTLMTIHSAKGLEFPVVFLPGMEDGIFPGRQAISGIDEDEMEEERRLAYVALTRAKERIYLLHTKSRILYGQTVFNPLSRFVDEIPDELLDEQDLTYEAQNHAGHEKDFAPFAGSSYASRGSRYAPRHSSAPQHTDHLTVGKPIGSPADASDRASVKALQEGDRVLHAKFGEGEILSIKDMGADKLIEVMFDTVGTKKLMATYAHLKKIDRT